MENSLRNNPWCKENKGKERKKGFLQRFGRLSIVKPLVFSTGLLFSAACASVPKPTLEEVIGEPKSVSEVLKFGEQSNEPKFITNVTGLFAPIAMSSRNKPQNLQFALFEEDYRLKDELKQNLQVRTYDNAIIRIPWTISLDADITEKTLGEVMEDVILRNDLVKKQYLEIKEAIPPENQQIIKQTLETPNSQEIKSELTEAKVQNPGEADNNTGISIDNKLISEEKQTGKRINYMQGEVYIISQEVIMNLKDSSILMASGSSIKGEYKSIVAIVSGIESLVRSDIKSLISKPDAPPSLYIFVNAPPLKSLPREYNEEFWEFLSWIYKQNLQQEEFKDFDISFSGVYIPEVKNFSGFKRQEDVFITPLVLMSYKNSDGSRKPVLFYYPDLIPKGTWGYNTWILCRDYVKNLGSYFTENTEYAELVTWGRPNEINDNKYYEKLRQTSKDYEKFRQAVEENIKNTNRFDLGEIMEGYSNYLTRLEKSKNPDWFARFTGIDKTEEQRKTTNGAFYLMFDKRKKYEELVLKFFRKEVGEYYIFKKNDSNEIFILPGTNKETLKERANNLIGADNPTVEYIPVESVAGEKGKSGFIHNNTVYCSLNLITSYNLNRAGSPDANYYNLAESEKFKTKTRTLADVVQFFYNLVGNSVGNFY